MFGRILLAAAATVALGAAPASAATYKVVTATHTSSSAKTETNYTGSSTASWKLARSRPIAINRNGGSATGLATLPVTGTYGIAVTTPQKSCAFSASTGDTGDYAALAPEEVTLAFGADPATGKGIYASFSAVRATLSNAYLPSECSTSISGEPEPEVTNALRVKRSQLKKKKLTLRFKGTTADEGIDYRWSTTIVLKRKRG